MLNDVSFGDLGDFYSYSRFWIAFDLQYLYSSHILQLIFSNETECTVNCEKRTEQKKNYMYCSYSVRLNDSN